MHILLMGLGNLLLGDDGVGIHTVEMFQKKHPDIENMTMVDGGTLSFTLTDPIADTEAWIVVDAIQLHAAPGTIGVYENQAMDEFVGGHKKSSVHEVNLSDLIDTLKLTDSLPRHRALVGIQPLTFDWDEGLTRDVENAVPQACDVILDIVNRWRRNQDKQQ